MDDNTIKKTISKNIVKYRKKAGLNQKEFAAKLGAAPSRVSSWETGANSTDIDTLFQICSILNVSINDMFEIYPDAEISLSYDEQEHIKKYRALTPPRRERVDTVLQWETEDMELIRDAKSPATPTDNIISIREATAYKVNAAHERTDIEATDEMRQHDDEIMDDENF